MSLDLKYTEAGFLPSSIDSLRLKVAQVPRSRDMAICVSTNDQLPLAAHGVITIVQGKWLCSK
jgi:hypothetical protein